MYYVIDNDVASTLDGLAGLVRRQMVTTRTNRDLDVVPYTEKGEPSKKYKPFRITLFNAPDWYSVWVYGLDSCAYKCASFLHGYFEPKGILVVWRGDGSIYDYRF